MKMRQGSITVFATLSIMLITAVLVTLVEAGRTVQLKRIAKINADSAIESMFARYQIPLWENYQLLGLDSSNREGQLCLNEQEIFLEDLVKNDSNGDCIKKNSYLNLLKMNIGVAKIEEYTFLTDGDGLVYQELVASYMKENAVTLALEKLREQTTKVDELNCKIGEAARKREAVKELSEKSEELCYEQDDTQIKDKEKSANNTNEQVKESLEKTSNINPINQVESLEKKGILSLVLEKDVEVSKKEIQNTEKLLSRRNNEIGTNYDLPKENFTKRMLLGQYLQNAFMTFGENETQNLEDKELIYELEYILEGNTSDYENLQEVVEKLVGIREVANFTYLLTDGVKMTEAENLAITLAGVSVNPAIIEIVKLGILASWAYGESILDVRALLKGYKVAIMKNAEEWTLELSNIGTIGDTFIMAKESKNGISYSQYISSLILLQPLKTKASRALDLTERFIQNQEGCEHFRIDHILVQAKVGFGYDWNTVFLGIGSIGKKSNQKLEYNVETQYAYFE